MLIMVVYVSNQVQQKSTDFFFNLDINKLYVLPHFLYYFMIFVYLDSDLLLI